MYSEDEFLQLSALQHFVFCPRQCALSYIEQIWEENLLTAEGGIMHEKAHEEKSETRDGMLIERGLRIFSRRLGLFGMADVVEFSNERQGKKAAPFPVEYKHGKPKANNCDKIQLCAQAICLEEMMGIPVSNGAIFYGKTRHRLDVIFDADLRRETEDTAYRLHEFINAGITPKPEYGRKCESCSLESSCMPKISVRNYSVSKYLKEAVQE